MKQYLKYFTIAFIFMIAGTLKAQSIYIIMILKAILLEILYIRLSWTPGDIQSKIVG